MFQEIIVFALKQARSCIFAGSFLALLLVSRYLPLGPIHRYDFLFIASVAIQAVLYYTKIETKDEIKTIALFHVLGLILEIYKTDPRVGSWAYPEPAFFKIHTVPLFSGFMYAAIGSYMSQAWRIMQMHLDGNMRYRQTTLLAIVIYLNFFTNHFWPDIRWYLIPLVFLVYRGVSVSFRVTEKIRRMPVSISFLLIAFFIWVAENISTYLGAWQYPYQVSTWNMVSFHKITSWYLLVIISFILVANLKHVKEARTTNLTPPSPSPQPTDLA